MALWNKQDQALALSNAAAGTSATFPLRGGSYWIETIATGAGTIDLKKLGPDGTTFTARITQITATAGQQTISLPPGTYEWVTTGFTAIYATAVRIPTAIE